MHPSQEEILTFFEFAHLKPGAPQEVSEACGQLAHQMALKLEDTNHGAELTTGLRKLLEAKDCLVRAALP